MLLPYTYHREYPGIIVPSQQFYNAMYCGGKNKPMQLRHWQLRRIYSRNNPLIFCPDFEKPVCQERMPRWKRQKYKAFKRKKYTND